MLYLWYSGDDAFIGGIKYNMERTSGKKTPTKQETPKNPQQTKTPVSYTVIFK